MPRDMVTMSISLSAEERELLDCIADVWTPGRSRQASNTIGRLIREKAAELGLKPKTAPTTEEK
jgi:hypothetical protein